MNGAARRPAWLRPAAWIGLLLAMACGAAQARLSLEALDKIVFANPPAALEQAQEVLKTSTDPELRLDAIRQAVIALYFDSESPGMAALVAEGTALAQRLHADDALCEMLLGKAFIASPFGEPSPEAEKLLQQARRIAERQKLHAQLSYVLRELSAYAHSAYRFTEAYELQLQAYAAAEASGHPFPKAYALLGMGSIETGSHRAEPDWDRGLRHLREGVALVDGDRYPAMAIVAHSTIGEVLRKKGDIDEARQHIERAVAYSEMLGWPEQLGLSLDLLAHIAQAQGRPDEALRLVDRATKLSGFVSGAKVFRLRLALLRATAWAAKGQRAPAEAALAEARQFAGEENNPEPWASYHEAAAKAHSLLGDYERAHRHMLELRRFEAQKANVANDRVISELNVKFDVERKEHESALIQARERESTLQRHLLSAGLAAAVLAVTALALLLRLQWAQRRKLGVLSAQLQQRNESLEDLNAKRTRLLAAACHDLRQPAHALGMLAETVSSTDAPAVLDSRLASIRRCCASLCDMLSMLMDLHRLEQGHYAPEIGPVALDTLLEEVELHFTIAAMQKGLSLKVRRCGAWVRTDPNLLRRIVFNLVSNAIRYTPRGRIGVDCRIVGDDVRLCVADTGIGIPRERLDDVFTEYVQLDRTGSADGLGIGLAIVKRAADLIGHRLHIESEPGRGTALSVDLPLHAGPPPSLTDGSTPEDHARPDPSQLIAIIENDRECREALHGLLASWGHTVVSGKDSDAVAAQLAPGTAPALVISDLHLGTEDGFGAIDTLRRRAGDPRLQALLLTGDLDATVAERAAASAVTLLHKPVQARRLRLAIGLALA